MTARDYPILRRWLKEAIQERVPVTPRVFVVHSTANPGAGDEMHVVWLDASRRHGWANWYLDHDSISEVVPEGWRAPAQGPTYNAKSLSLEMCEPDRNLPWTEQVRRFNETWSRAVWLVADRTVAYRQSLEWVKNHAQISSELPNETDHTDPLEFFNRYNRTWDDFIADVGALVEEMLGALPAATDWQQGYISSAMAAGLISERKHPNQPVVWWNLAVQNLKLLERIRLLENRLAALEQKPTVPQGGGGNGETTIT